MASIEIQNAPKNLTMLEFRAVADDLGGPAKACRFASVIRPVGNLLRQVPSWQSMTRDLIYLNEIAEMPGRGFMNMDVRYYGPSHKLPFQTSYEDLNMTYVCRSASLERQFFDDWMTVINPINTFDFNYRDDYRADIDIYQYSDIGYQEAEAEYMITVHNAYPVMLSGQPLMWADQDIQKLIVSFTYSHWSRKGLDPVAALGPLVRPRANSSPRQ